MCAQYHSYFNDERNKAVSELLGEPYDNAKNFLRPLFEDYLGMKLDRDKSVLAALEKWLCKIILASRPYDLPFDSKTVYQLANIRGDLNAYTVAITDVKILKEILNY